MSGSCWNVLKRAMRHAQVAGDGQARCSRTVSTSSLHVSGGRPASLEYDHCRVALSLVPLHGSVGRCRLAQRLPGIAVAASGDVTIGSLRLIKDALCGLANCKSLARRRHSLLHPPPHCSRLGKTQFTVYEERLNVYALGAGASIGRTRLDRRHWLLKRQTLSYGCSYPM
jgi:hypothetical protein